MKFFFTNCKKYVSTGSHQVRVWVLAALQVNSQ